MKIYRYSWLLITLTLILSHCNIWAQGAFDKDAYYTAFADGHSASLDEQLKRVTMLSGADKDAFEGALLMRKAGTEFSPAKKLSLFKEGGKKLEAAIKASSQNAEYRFLRLMIQENAPKIVGYSHNLKDDSNMIKTKFGSLSKVTQNAVNDYARKSKYL